MFTISKTPSISMKNNIYKIFEQEQNKTEQNKMEENTEFE